MQRFDDHQRLAVIPAPHLAALDLAWLSHRIALNRSHFLARFGDFPRIFPLVDRDCFRGIGCLPDPGPVRMVRAERDGNCREVQRQLAELDPPGSV